VRVINYPAASCEVSNIPGYKLTDASLFDTAMHLYLEPYKKKKPLCSKTSRSVGKGSIFTYGREDIGVPGMGKSLQRIYRGSRNGHELPGGLQNR
jgi:hypothetical protein